MIPKTDTALRLGALFHRRPTTHWSDKEVQQYKKLHKLGAFNNIQDIVLIEDYYAAERKKKDGGLHRRDLYTFLNNFLGELDRATAFSEEQHRVQRKAIDKGRKAERPASEEEWQRIGALAKAQLERFKQDFA
jgi:hypothetical protein